MEYYHSTQEVIKAIQSKAVPAYAQKLQGYFKTGPGDYGEGDLFWGVRNPQVRDIAKKSIRLSLDQLDQLLAHQVHEVRLVGLLILVAQYQKATTDVAKARLFQFYCTQFHRINNWDLVDLSAYHIVGEYCYSHSTEPLYKWVKSDHLWTRRIAVIACLYFIKKDRFEEILDFCIQLRQDPEPLMHKACGWMLRELGKRNEVQLKIFLNVWGTQLPRTAIRYAIERFEAQERELYLKITKSK